MKLVLEWTDGVLGMGLEWMTVGDESCCGSEKRVLCTVTRSDLSIFISELSHSGGGQVEAK